MPTVPTYDNFQVNPTGGFDGRVSPSVINPDAAAQPGRQMQELGGNIVKAGGQIADVLTQQQQDQNVADARKALLGFMETADARMNDPKAGFTMQQGQNAVDGLLQYQQDIKGAFYSAREGLTNPAALKMLDEAATRYVGVAMQQGYQHAAQQGKIAQQDDATSKIQLDKRMLSNNVDNPVLFKQLGNTLDDDVLNLALLKGIPPGSPAYAELLSAHRSDAYSNAITQTLAKDPTAANDMLERFKDYLEPAARDALVSRVGNAVRDSDVVTAASTAVGTARTNLFDGSGNMVVSSTDAINNMGDGVAKEAVAAYQAQHPGDTIGAHRVQQETRAQWHQQAYVPAVQQQENLHFSLLTTLDQSNITTIQGLMQNPDLAKQYQALEPKMQASIDGHIHQLWSQQQAVVTANRAEARAERADARASRLQAVQEKAAQSADTRDALLGMTITNPTAFVQLDPANYSNAMTPGDALKVITVQRQMKSTNDTAMRKDVDAEDVKAMWPLLKSAGINPEAKPNTPGNLQYNSFVGKLNATVKDYQAQTKKPVTPDQLQEITRDLLVTTEVTTPGMLWDSTTKKQLWQLAPDEEDRASADIPAGTRSTLSNFFTQRYGRAPSESEIQMLNTAQTLHRGNRQYFNQLDTTFKAKPKSLANEVPQ